MSKKSTDVKLDRLFDLFLDDLLSRLRNTEERPTAAELAVIAKFLKDNKVEPLGDNPLVGKLGELLANYESDEEMAEEQL